VSPTDRVVTALRGLRAVCPHAEANSALGNWLAKAQEALKEYDEFLHVEKDKEALLAQVTLERDRLYASVNYHDEHDIERDQKIEQLTALLADARRLLHVANAIGAPGEPVNGT